MICIRRATRYQQPNHIRWWDQWPWLVAVHVTLSMAWLMVYLLDWLVGLKLYLGCGNASLASGMFFTVGITGTLAHMISVYWLYDTKNI